MGTTEDKFDDSKEFLWAIRVGIWSIFYVQYQDSIRVFNAKLWREYIFKPTGNKSLHANSKGNSGGAVNIIMSKHLSRAQCSPHQDTHKYTCTRMRRLTIRLIPSQLMSDLSQELTIILLTMWQLQMFRKECPSVNKVTESLDKEILKLKKLNNVKVTEDHEPDTFSRVAAMPIRLGKILQKI